MGVITWLIKGIPRLLSKYDDSPPASVARVDYDKNGRVTWCLNDGFDDPSTSEFESKVGSPRDIKSIDIKSMGLVNAVGLVTRYSSALAK